MKVSILAQSDCVLLRWPLGTIVAYLATQPRTDAAVSLLAGADVSAKLIRRLETDDAPLRLALGTIDGDQNARIQQQLEQRLQLAAGTATSMFGLAAIRSARLTDTMVLQCGENARLCFVLSGCLVQQIERATTVAGPGTFVGASQFVGGVETVAWTREASAWLEWDSAVLAAMLRLVGTTS